MTFYFLFLESIGTPELVLIAFVALIVFGPRKLPGIGRQIGKYTSEFKRASNDFRRNWEYEVEAAEREESLQREIGKMAGEPNKNEFAAVSTAANVGAVENTIGRTANARAANDENSFAALNNADSLAMPEIRAVSQADFQQTAAPQPEPSAAAPRRKREWL